MDEIPGYEPLPGSHQVVVPGAQAIGPADARQDIEVTLKLRRKQPLPDPPGPASTPLTREQLANDYGASPEDIDAVTRMYIQLGLKNSYADAATRTVKFSGSVAEMERAFRVRLLDYRHPAGDYRGRTGHIYIPKQLSGIVEAVFGLDDPPIRHRIV
ncbi:MAG TPA: protease pro-enzyme activation domain-containing protein [Puia sp.]|uniref:protease pro-enzyme activation domain-containing protein n=1 Tax=Puia sp. TaxID=2045100 RepID=UPI002C633ABA|nr:protease pro-enzyme activation domain-containing protein [Puia sp.]HVU96923.1 protease pro-enzyme activation domain-containing protein [Puia sp.]